LGIYRISIFLGEGFRVSLELMVFSNIVNSSPALLLKEKGAGFTIETYYTTSK